MPDRNRWNYTPEERKEEIVAALEDYLRQHPEELTDREKLLLRDAIGHAYRGLFAMAVEDVYDLARPESDWAARVAPAMVAGITREILNRALEALKHSPAQTFPVFR
jgi:hypothetical protein